MLIEPTLGEERITRRFVAVVGFSGDERRGLEADVLVEGQAHRLRLRDARIVDGSRDIARLLNEYKHRRR